MLRIHSISETSFSNLTFLLSDRKSKMNLILLTFNYTDEPFLHEFNTHILNSIKKLNLDNLEESVLEKNLKEFFVALNWQLFSKFCRLEGNYEKGISLAFILSIKHKIYVIEFGRMLSGVLRKNKFEYIGRSWENFHIKTKQELFLFGSRDEDIHVKIYQTEIDDDSLFIAIPSLVVEDMKSKIDVSNLRRKIRYLYRKQNFPYVILSTKNFKIIPQEAALKKAWRRFWKK
ncbi:MAG: hypothetical protein APR54_06045 [Candidatus Cloacimonas sp. SDB]|nr:MAG: hypothetical protein APR54_06045 [Candidatus Cloacimonas sp. SDB]